MGEVGEAEGRMWMSGRLTTAREPRERGCSGSEIVEIRSVRGGVSNGSVKSCQCESGLEFCDGR